ncbi:MAG: RdgB/HAM1 family non-canonical purine NTP pyrophosphatase [Saprospiraceae bacterium]
MEEHRSKFLELIVASANQHKIDEIQEMMPPEIQLLSLKDIGMLDDIPETATTLEGNASLKAKHVFDKLGKDCFGEDTGLEVFALEMEPGVYSARYAGPERSTDANVSKVLEKLKIHRNRNAQFRTVICLILKGKEYFFEGLVKGNIAYEKYGTGGFGYDPIFIPDGYEQTFGELSVEIKNKISHRAEAVKKMMFFIKNL